MNTVPGAVSATAAQKYGKTVVRWAPVVTRPIGQPLEVIPVSAEQPRAGSALAGPGAPERPARIRIKIGRGEDTTEAVTNANG
jgi:hypothetical protein